MAYPFNYPNPTNADVQIFTGATASQTNRGVVSWTKPQGCSFVWFTLIGQGGNGAPSSDGSTAGGGGGSGAITNCLMPAFLVPDSLFIRVGNSVTGSVVATTVYYKTSTGNYSLLNANNGLPATGSSAGAGGTATTATTFGCAGLYQSIAGQAGQTNTNITASATTFLSGGIGSGSTQPNSITANYGFSLADATATKKLDGFFLMQPIIVGLGGSNNGTNTVATAGVGCGGAGISTNQTTAGLGGPGLAVIISW